MGDFYGPSGWDGSFLFDGQSLFCCKDDERWAQSVNDYGDTVSIMASATIVRLAERGELTFDRRVGIVRIDDNGVLYGNQFIMRPSEVLHTEQFATAGSVTENPEPSALLLLAGGAALIAMKRRRVSQ